MKPSNYYTQNIETIIEASKATGEQITVQLRCGRAKTNVIDFNIDLLHAVKDLHKYVVKKQQHDYSVLKDKRYSFELVPAGRVAPDYEVSFCKELLGYKELLHDAVVLAQKHKNSL